LYIKCRKTILFPIFKDKYSEEITPSKITILFKPNLLAMNFTEDKPKAIIPSYYSSILFLKFGEPTTI
jgi:hypothetical protein